MDTCPECGNHDMRVRLVDGVPVHECGLCGAEFGDRAVLAALEDAATARERGYAAAVWPLVRALDVLPGLVVREAQAGDVQACVLPFVELGVRGTEGLGSLENLAKLLQLAARALACHWIVEVEYRRHLAFVLKPRHGGGPVPAPLAQGAQGDLAVLRAEIERSTRLSWWLHPTAP